MQPQDMVKLWRMGGVEEDENRTEIMTAVPRVNDAILGAGFDFSFFFHYSHHLSLYPPAVLIRPFPSLPIPPSPL